MMLCPFCPRVFATARDLEQHLQAKRLVSRAHGFQRGRYAPPEEEQQSRKVGFISSRGETDGA